MEDEIAYYYDSHATEKDRMGQPAAHSSLLHYLWNVLDWLFQGQTYAMLCTYGRARILCL